MVRWPGSVRFRRVGTLEQVDFACWRAYVDGDSVERRKKSEAVDAFLDAFVVGCYSSFRRPTT